MRTFEIYRKEKNEQEKIFGTIKNDEFKINNPTMKEVSKLETNTIEEPDILGNFKKDNIVRLNGKNLKNTKEGDNLNNSLMHIHRLSMRKKEIGKMRNNLINSNARKEKYMELVNIDKAKAEQMADIIFKRRLRHISIKKNNNDFMQLNSCIIPKNRSFLGRLKIEIDSPRNKLINKENNENKNVILKTENINSYRNKSKNNIGDNIDSDRIKSPRIHKKNDINSRSYINIKQNKNEIKKYNNEGIKEIEIDQNIFRKDEKNNSSKYKINIGKLIKENPDKKSGQNTSREINRLKIPLNKRINELNVEVNKNRVNNTSRGKENKRGVFKSIPLEIKMINNISNIEYKNKREEEKKVIKRSIITAPNLVKSENKKLIVKKKNKILNKI